MYLTDLVKFQKEGKLPTKLKSLGLNFTFNLDIDPANAKQQEYVQAQNSQLASFKSLMQFLPLIIRANQADLLALNLRIFVYSLWRHDYIF